MKVNAILPTRDRPDLLRRAIASVRAQTCAVDEIIVVNDGAVAVREQGITLVEVGPGAGAGIARNAGALAATGDWLAFLDDDDEWDEVYLEEALRCAGDAHVILTGFMKVRANGEVVPEKVPPERLVAEEWFVRNQGLRGSNILIRRDVYLRLRGFDEALACTQDLDFAIRLADSSVPYARNPAQRVIFHAHSGPRISTPSPRNGFGNQGYLARHGRRMTTEQMRAFRARTEALFDADPGPTPTLIWVLGPPGAGKTTWTQCLAAAEGARVLELANLLDWRDGADYGVSTAKRHLVAAIRAVELERTETERRLFVVAAFLPPTTLAPLSAREHLIALVPTERVWRARIARRGDVSDLMEREYASWAERYGVGTSAAYHAAMEAQ